MRTQATAIPEIKIIAPRPYVDSRGRFVETYHATAFKECGINEHFVQDNQSYSTTAGTIRGLHFQIPPFAQAKLVRVLRGAIFDVAVDLRLGSPTFGRHVGVVLRALTFDQLHIPVGFAHGLCTLEDHTEVAYKVSAHYSAPHDRGLLWHDPELAIAWPVDARTATVSSRDRSHPRLADLPAYFCYRG